MTAPSAQPAGVALPAGYTLYDPQVLEIMRLLHIDPRSSTTLYGGSTMNWRMDGRRIWHLGCCAEKDNFFKYRVFSFQNNVLTEIPLSDVGEGRGDLTYDLDGYMCYSSWQGSQFRPASGPARVPGVTPIPVAGGAGPAAGGTYHPIQPNAYNPALDGQQISSARALDMAGLFGTPSTAKAYVCRFSVKAAQADIRGRLGTDTQPGQFTVPIQTAGLQNSQVGIVNAGTAGALWLSIVDGNGQPAAANVWITVAGYFM